MCVFVFAFLCYLIGVLVVTYCNTVLEYSDWSSLTVLLLSVVLEYSDWSGRRVTIPFILIGNQMHYHLCYTRSLYFICAIILKYHFGHQVFFQALLPCQVWLIASINGAPAMIRTPDILITSEVLYQLSYKGIIYIHLVDCYFGAAGETRTLTL
mgnify:FL=1